MSILFKKLFFGLVAIVYFLWPGTVFAQGGPDSLWIFDDTAGHNVTSLSIQGTYEPIVGDFNGDSIDDILWYGAGSAPDFLWLFNNAAGHTNVSLTIAGTYQPIVGDFNGNDIDDILWYGAGSDPDFLWLFDDKAVHTDVSLTIAGTYQPIVGDFGGASNNGHPIDDILWYGAGSDPDFLWLFDDKAVHTDVSVSIAGTYEPIVGDFNGDFNSDILWYGAGSAPDSLWLFTGNDSADHTVVDLTISGTYEPIVGDFGGPSPLGFDFDDVLWYGAGSAPDSLWLFNNNADHTVVSLTISGTYEPIVGDFNGNDIDDILWYGADSAPDSLWLFTGNDSADHTVVDLAISGTYQPIVGDFGGPIYHTGNGIDDILWYGADSVPGTPPIANAATVDAVQGQAKSISLTGSDADGDTLSFTVVTQPANGTLSGTAPNLSYTSNGGFEGTDSFTFKVNDGTIDSATATVTINVAAATGGNNAPTANAQTLNVTSAQAKSVTLTGSDADSDPLTFVLVTQPSNGSLSGTAPNLSYTSNGGFVGTDSFTFKVNDGKVDSAAVTIIIVVNSSQPTEERSKIFLPMTRK